MRRGEGEGGEKNHVLSLPQLSSLPFSASKFRDQYPDDEAKRERIVVTAAPPKTG
jgi:hypothetical protein